MLNYKSVSQKNTLTCSVIPLLLQNWPKTVANILKEKGNILFINLNFELKYASKPC